VQVYGRVFTAWGIAGLLAPVFAGFLYEQTGNYQTALIVAGCAGLISLISVWTIPQKREIQPSF
jgi:OFA family oxalate/formate antiporter-like MFS transporter